MSETMLPDYPPTWRKTDGPGERPYLIHTRKQAEAGKIIAKGQQILHRGVVNGTLPDVPA